MSASTTATTDESVVLLDEDGRHIGSAAKTTVHHAATPLHLGFSCYLFDADGHVLLTRRALGKVTWPGVWSNSFCGHPAPGEQVENAVRRRAAQELGVSIESLVCVLPDFRYRAVAADGTVENEICPVFFARCDDRLRPDPDEVMEWMWVSWKQLRSAVALPWSISPWAMEQIPLLDERYLHGSWPQFISE
ncbi:isopentenyl-diphosphate Delta-isomerase [Mycobacterium sp. IS-3022]|uniref:isopentenyl-diphosphate Delta-isomerase n=1 Tax=Mycobacterium sp. IS-3022 TaxID=1772277 RepID=UPI0007417D53|nr:isopentenyl-diphosphate Delta-isomerase [Mycobacterium sp. IS-3022]KUI00015.1 isopentenyl-diphosphate delta-isomerase [Mycobacterium sp. IS-3022]